MAAELFLLLLALVTGTNAWLGEYACENVVLFGSRTDVEQCFQDKFPSPVAETFLKCAQNSHVSRAYTVLRDYCQDGRFQDEINNCMNQEESITLVTQNVAFRTLRTCLDWLPRTIPDESSESGEDSGRAIRKRDTDNNEIDTDEKAPKGEEKGEETVNDQTVVVTEQAEPSLVTEIINVIDALTEAPTEEKSDVKPDEVVNDKTNDIPAEDIEGPPSHDDGQHEDVKEEEAEKIEEENKGEEARTENDEGKANDGENNGDEIEEVTNEGDKDEEKEGDNEDTEDQDEEQGGDENEGEDDEGDENGDEDDNEENEEAGDGGDDEDNPSEESDTDDDEDFEDQEDEEQNSIEELDTDDDDSSSNEDAEDNSSSNEDIIEDFFDFTDYDFPFDFFGSSEEGGSHELINSRYNRINFEIYINKK